MLPRTCVIGAGISGLNAGKALGDAGVPYECFESSDRIGGNWAFGNPNGHSSAYRSLHIDTSKDLVSFRDFPMDASYPDFPHHSEIKEYLERYAEAFGLKQHIAFETGVEQRPAPGRRRLGGAHHGRRDARVTTRWWWPTGTTGTRACRTSRASSAASRSTRTPTSRRPSRWTCATSGSWWWASATAPPTSPASCRRRRWATRSRCRRARARGWCPSTPSAARATAWARRCRTCRCAWQRRLVRGLPRLISGRPEDYGLPTPNHNFLEAHPTRVQRAAAAAGLGRRARQAQRRRAWTAASSTSPTAPPTSSTRSSTPRATTSPSRSSTSRS